MAMQPLQAPSAERRWSATGHPLHRRILEMQRFAGMDERMDRVRRERGLGKAREDQLELAGIGGDVADRENPRPRGGAGRGVDADPMVVEVEPPCRERAEIGGEPE